MSEVEYSFVHHDQSMCGVVLCVEWMYSGYGLCIDTGCYHFLRRGGFLRIDEAQPLNLCIWNE